MSRLAAWLVPAIVLAFRAALAAPAGFPPQIIPPDAPWTVSLPDLLGDRVLRIPDDLPALNTLPAPKAAEARRAIARIEENRSYMRKIGERFFAASELDRYVIRPDYEHTLSIAAVSIALDDVERLKADPLWRHRPILDALPDYSQILVRIPEAAAGIVTEAIQRLPQRDRIRTGLTRRRKTDHGIPYTRPSRWIRDSFLVADDRRTGSPLLLLPPAYAQLDSLVDNDLRFFEPSQGWMQPSLRIPAFVRGGNLHAADNAAGQRILFIGERERVFHAEAFRYATRHEPPAALFDAIIERIAHEARVVVLPNSSHLFHIDMVVGFPRRGVAAILSPLPGEPLSAADRQVIATTRAVLLREGFRIIDIPTTAARVAAFQSPVNAVPFRNRRSGKASLLLPVFPDATVVRDGHPQSLNAWIEAAYRHEELAVIPVDERFYPNKGNTHCALRALD